MITKTHIYMLQKLPDKVVNKIKVTKNGCWWWCKSTNRNGYGKMHLTKGHYELSHRHVFKLIKGEIKPGLVLDHHCKNRLCCNPTHLSPVTQKQNVHRGKARLFKRIIVKKG